MEATPSFSEISLRRLGGAPDLRVPCVFGQRLNGYHPFEGLEFELILVNAIQKPVLRGEVGARALRNPEGRGKGRRVVKTSEHTTAWALSAIWRRVPLYLWVGWTIGPVFFIGQS
jgi:hypothetical protein